MIEILYEGPRFSPPNYKGKVEKLEKEIESLTAKLEATTKALENIATHSDGIPGDEGDDAFYDYCEVKDLASAALKSIK